MGKRGIAWRAAAQAGGVFLFAFILRLVYIHQLAGTYFFAPFKGGYDDVIFDNWAMEILRGNWLGDPVIYIYRMPLYVYILAGIYYLFGHSYWAVYIIQSIVSAGTCVLVYAIGRLYFTPAVGVIAGLLTALYAPFLYYNGMLVGETVGIFLTCLAFLSLAVFQRSHGMVPLFLSGLCVGLSMLARGNMLIVLPFIMAWVALTFRSDGAAKAAGRLAVLLAGVILAVSPVMIRNYAREKDVVPITALGGLNVYIGNAYGADGRYNLVKRVGNNAETMIKDSIEVAERAAGRRLKPSQVSNYWIGQTLRSIQEHGPGYLMPLYFQKLVLFWNAYELPDIWDIYFMQAYIPVLSWPLVSFSFVTVLFAIGAYLSWDRRRELSLFYVFIIGYMLSLVSLFITSRYRMQVVPFLAVFGAFSLFQLKNIWKIGTVKVVASVVILILAIIFTNIHVRRTSYETSFNSLAVLLKRAGHFEDAIQTYKKAIEIAPMYPTPYYNLALLYRDIGDRAQAIFYLEKALEVAPDFKPAIEELRAMRE